MPYAGRLGANNAGVTIVKRLMLGAEALQGRLAYEAVMSALWAVARVAVFTMRTAIAGYAEVVRGNKLYMASKSQITIQSTAALHWGSILAVNHDSSSFSSEAGAVARGLGFQAVRPVCADRRALIGQATAFFAVLPLCLEDSRAPPPTYISDNSTCTSSLLQLIAHFDSLLLQFTLEHILIHFPP